MMTHQWPAPAKLNLFLSIIGRRPDGYHLLQTLLQFLNYGDTLTITPTYDGRIRLLTSFPGVVQDENLIVRAAQLLQHHCCMTDYFDMPGADIYLQKILPIGGGLGGGSSNAATVLLVLNIEWNCSLNLTDLAQLGLTLGADIPVFIHGNAAFVEGIGEKITAAKPDEKWYFIAVPPISISTPMIFNDPTLQITSPVRSFEQFLTMPFHNDFEPFIRKKFSVIEQYFSWLLKHGPTRLTGTGACIFTEFDTESAARYVLSQAPEWINGFVAQGINTSPLHRKLLSVGLTNYL